MEKGEKEMTILEKCGILFVALVAKENMPIPPYGFSIKVGRSTKSHRSFPRRVMGSI
jgi:hypothetical protein